MMRIVFMGSPDDVVAPLRHLHDHGPKVGLELIAVISQPARPVGRGGKLQDPPVASFAKDLGVPCLQPDSARAPEFLEAFRELRPDVVVTAAYGQILSDEFLKIPRIGTINIHPSRIPQYRGATPVPASLLDGLKTTAVTILFTVKKLDAGNIILQQEFAIEATETAGALTKRLFEASGAMLMEALVMLAKSPEFQGVPQDDAKATFCKKIEKDMGFINWNADAVTVFNRFRAFEPWPGSWTAHGGRRIAVTDMALLSVNQQSASNPGQFLFDKPSKSLIVTCAKGAIAIRRLKPAGGKDMDAPSFWNGLKDKTDLTFHMISPESQ